MSEDKIMTRRDEIETLLPFYLNGTLSGEDLAAVDDWLANDPGAQKALLAAEDELSETVALNESLRPDANAFKRFSDDLAKESGRAASPLVWLSAWLRETFAVPAPLVWATAAAMLALAVVTAGNLGGQGGNDIEVAGTGSAAAQPFVLATFKPDAKLAEIATLLKASGAQIVEGPGASGAFKISISATTIADYDAVAAALQKSPLVASLIPGRKPDEAKK